MSDYVEHLKTKLREVDKGIVAAEARFERSEASEKARALAELTQLRIRHDDLANRIKEAEEKGTDQWSSLRTGFQEEVDGLKDTLEKWLTKI